MSVFQKKIKLALKNPRLAWHKAKVTLLDENLAKWNYNFRDGYASPPNVIAARLTNLCNCNCKMCGQPKVGDKGIPDSFFRDHLNTDQWKDLIDQVAGYKPNFYLWGGEPLIYKGIWDIVEHAKSRGLTVQMNTNAQFLQRSAEQIVSLGMDDLIISIDGPEKVHDEIRGVPGLYQQIKAGIQKVQELKKQQKKRHPVIRIRGVINPDYYDHLHDLINITRDLEGDTLSFNHFWFTSNEKGQLYEKVMQKCLGTKATSWKGFVYEPNGLALDELRKELIKLKNNNADFPITVSPGIYDEGLEKYYYDLDETFGAKTCYTIYFKTYLMPNGDVTPCPDFPDYIAGNVREERFADIWNGERYRNFRRHLKEHKLLPICARCCDLHVGNVAFF